MSEVPPSRGAFQEAVTPPAAGEVKTVVGAPGTRSLSRTTCSDTDGVPTW